MDDISKNWAYGMYVKEKTSILRDILNEKRWILGSRSKDEENMHRDNVRRLELYLAYLNAQIAKLEEE